MKKMLALLLSLAMLLSLAACGSGGDSSSSSSGEAAALSMSEDIQNYLAKVDQSYVEKIAETLAYDENYLSNELGWRSAGSDAEHAAADFLAQEMAAIGLAEVEKVPVTVDRWQFNDASLTIAGTDIDIMPASYPANGMGPEGLTAEIVDCGTGFAEDYEGKDVEGKIALVAMDWEEGWIDNFTNEAWLHGAVALVTYSLTDYAQYSDDMMTIQTYANVDRMPTVSISVNQAKEIQAAIAAGNDQATLILDNVLEPDQGTTYNVVGRIAGRSSDQQIIVSAHYDLFFKAFQDDSTAVGLVLAMAKGMVDSGYQPENDILFVCHGAEEWGAIGSQYDWTTGAWEMIHTAHPEWAGKTIAMLNFELPGTYDGAQQWKISCVPEFANLAAAMAGEDGVFSQPVNDVYPRGLDPVSVDTNTQEDGISYRWHGVPYFINIPGFEGSWAEERYHTLADDRDTYSPDVMQTNLNNFGALAIYLDKTPALALDLTLTCDDLEEALNEELATAAGADSAAYLAAVGQLRTAAETLNGKIADVNARYESAAAADASQEELDAIRAEGKVLNQLTLDAYRAAQDGLVGIILGDEVTSKFEAYQRNVELLGALIEDLENQDLANEEETGALDLAWHVNSGADYLLYNFSPEVYQMLADIYSEEKNPGNTFWGTGKGFDFAQVAGATLSLFDLIAAQETGETIDCGEAIAIYQAALNQQTALLKDAVTAETEAIQGITAMLG